MELNKRRQSFLEKVKQNPIRSLLYYTAFSMLIMGLLMDNPLDTIDGLVNILRTPNRLISDYFGTGSIASAFVNSAIVTFLTLFMFDYIKVKYNGTTIAVTYLMAGFSLFGKNFLNILPILLGVYIYSKTQGDAFRKYIYIALMGTSLAPIVSEIANGFDGGRTPLAIACAIIVGAFAGFLVPALTVESLRVLQGFTLYNTGFAAGIIGLLLSSLIASFGISKDTSIIWKKGIDPVVIGFLYVFLLSLILFGYMFNGKSFKGYTKIFRHSGRAVADFTVMDGIPVTLINMGVVGIFATTYVYVIGGDLNGPTMGAILTIIGFGALGKHLRNMIPLMIGVILMSFLSSWTLTDPSIQLAILFVTGLAPISGTFGMVWGVVAGMVHSVVVLSVTSLHGGLNLYNNGFASAFVVLLTHPIIEALSRDKEVD